MSLSLRLLLREEEEAVTTFDLHVEYLYLDPQVSNFDCADSMRIFVKAFHYFLITSKDCSVLISCVTAHTLLVPAVVVLSNVSQITSISLSLEMRLT